MTEVKFFGQQGLITGFEISGHCTFDADDFDGKLICSSVSSAGYMAANTILEIVGARAVVDIDDDNGFMSVKLKTKLDESQVTLKGLLLHLSELAKQYRKYLKVYSEV